MRFLLAGLAALTCVLMALVAIAPRWRGARWRPLAVASVVGLCLAASIVCDPSIAPLALPAAAVLGVAVTVTEGISAGYDFRYLMTNLIPLRMSSTYGYIAAGPEHEQVPMIAHDRWVQWRLRVMRHRSERIAFPVEART